MDNRLKCFFNIYPGPPSFSSSPAFSPYHSLSLAPEQFVSSSNQPLTSNDQYVLLITQDYALDLSINRYHYHDTLKVLLSSPIHTGISSKVVSTVV